jgi:integrase
VASVKQRTTAKGERRYDVRYRTPAGEPRKETFGTRRDAERRKVEVEADKHRGVFVDVRAGRTTLAEWGDVYWAGVLNLRPTTRERDELMYAKHVLPVFGDVPLAAIGRLEVRSWVADLSRNGLAPTSVHTTHQILAKVMSAAVDVGMLAFSPCDRTPLPRVERTEMRFATPDELAVLAETIDSRYRCFVLLGGYCGLRAGEMYGLRRKRVDVVRRTVDIAECLTAPGGVVMFGPPKTRASRRKVPMPALVADALAEHLADVDDDPDALVFTATKGGPLRTAHFRTQVWLPATRAAGLEGLRIHDLRHSAVAYWIETGARPNEIAARAGHTSVAVVLDRYGHLLPKTDDAVTDRLDAMARAAAEKVFLRRAAGDVVDLNAHRPRHGRAME